jgi:predicted amidohydrolase
MSARPRTHKRIMSATGPAEVGPADWDRADWQTPREELAAAARLAGELRLSTVLGSVHPLTPPHRPHNSMYVLSDRGELVTPTTSACYRTPGCRACTRLAPDQ